MTEKKSFKEVLTPSLSEIEEGRIRVTFSKGDQEMASLYYEKAKKGWTNKPIMPKAWRCVDSKIHDASIYDQGLIEPKELVGWGQELIQTAGF